MTQSIIKFIQSAEGQAALAEATKNAVAELHAAGLPSVGLIDGVVSMRWPDGRVEPVTEESRARLDEVQRRRKAAFKQEP